MVSSCQYYGNPRGQEATIGIMGGDEETPLSAIRPCQMEVLPNKVLNLSGSLYLIIGYLLKGEYG